MKNLKKILSNEAGMSLVEVIVAAAISVIISGAVMKTNQTGIKGVQTVSTKISLQMWQSTVLMNQLSDPAGCMNNHSGSVAAHSRADLVGKDGNPIATNGQEIVGTGGDWQLGGGAGNPVQFQAFVEDTPGSTKGRCDVSITITNLRNGFGGKTQTLNIPVTCTTDTGQTTIQSCSATMDASDNVWQLTLGGGVIPEHISSGATRNVLVGLEDGTGGNTDDLTASFQVNIGDSDFPNGSGSGVIQSMRILGERRALVFDQVGLFESGDCLFVGTDNAGALNMRNSFCNTTASINSTGVIFSSDGASSVSSISSEITGSSGTVISASNSRVTGTGSAAIASTGSGTQLSVASGMSSVVLGASHVTVSGNYSMGSGTNNTVSGQGSFTTGKRNVVSGANSFAAGYWNTASGASSFALGYGSVASGAYSFASGNYARAYGSYSYSLGLQAYSNASRSYAIGSYVNVDSVSSYSYGIGKFITVGAPNSMVLGNGASSTNRASQSREGNLLAMFDGGLDFKTDPNDQFNESKNFYIDAGGNVGIGKDVGYVPPSGFLAGVKPKLFVNGNTDINGYLIVEAAGSSIKTAGWTTATLASGWSHYSGLQLQYLKDPFGFVHLRGGVTCNAGDTGCPWSGTNGTSKVMNLPAGHGYPRVLAAFTCAHRYYTGSTVDGSGNSAGCGVHIYNNTLHVFSSYASSRFPMLDGITWKID